MLKFLPCALLVLTISLCHGRRLHKRQDSEPVVVAARPPPKPPATEAPPPVPPAPTVQPQVPEQQPVQPQVPLQPQPPQQPIAPLQGAVLGLSPEGTPVLLQAPQQPRLTQQQWRHLFSPPRNFAPGFEAKPIPEDASLNQPRVQWIGAEQQQPVDPAVLGANGKQVPLQQLNLGVIRPQEQQSAKSNQLRLSGIPPPDQQAPSDEELKQRILEQAIRSQVNTAGRDREAFLARINVTGNHDAAKEFVRQLKNLSDFQEKQPFASVDVMKGLINAEISLAVDNWILNEEIAGQMAATFGIPRESVSSAFVLTPADVDEMKISGNNPTAAKTFHVKFQELLWTKVDQQYRVTTDLLATLSDAYLGLLVGNGIVKEKFAEDIATHFYRANNRKIKLF